MVCMIIWWLPTNVFAFNTNVINVGLYPRSATLVGTDLYITIRSEDKVIVMDTTTNTITDTILVGTAPVAATLVGTDLYVMNAVSSNVSVIDTTTKSVTDTIPVVGRPGEEGAILVGTKLYVMTNDYNYYTGRISVIDTISKTVTTTIPISATTTREKLVGSNLYITDDLAYGVSVVDTITDTKTGTITIGLNGRSLFVHGTDLYVIKVTPTTDNIVVIDTNTNTITTTLSVDDIPYDGYIVGDDLYVLNSGNSITVIDMNTNTITDSILIGGDSLIATLVGSNLYVVGQYSGNVLVVDTNTKTLTDTISVPTSAGVMVLVGSKLYMTAQSSIYIIDTNTNTLMELGIPVLNSAQVTDSSLRLTYDEVLSPGSVPSTDDFSVTVDNIPMTISSISVDNTDLIFVLADPVSYGQFVKINYTVPLLNPTQDVSGNRAEGLIEQVVTNNTSPKHSFVYTAGAHGTLSGETNQMISEQGLGTPVTAIADDGYVFVRWDDEITDNPRTDSNILSDYSVQAIFEVYIPPADSPVVSNLPATDITKTSARIHAEVSDTGGADITSTYFVYLKNSDWNNGQPDQDKYYFVPSENQQVGIGEFSANISDLVCGTDYLFLGFAENSDNQGVAFDPLGIFTTLPCQDNIPTPTLQVSSGGGSIIYGCKDPNATNYNYFSTSNPSLCKYGTTSATPSLPKGNMCPANQILTQNLRAPSRNGVYNNYTKGIVKEARILQVHLNRLGFSSGKEDGILGKQSDSAIKRMQKLLGTKQDGYVGPVTRGLINNSCGANGLQN